MHAEILTKCTASVLYQIFQKLLEPAGVLLELLIRDPTSNLELRVGIRVRL